MLLLQEQHLVNSSAVGSPLTHQLLKEGSFPMKKLRTSTVQCVERPLRVKAADDYDIRCLEGQPLA